MSATTTDFLAFVECKGCGETFAVRSRFALTRAKWCSERCRRRQYAGRCVDCGAETNGNDGPGYAAERCRRCANATRMFWTPERVIAAIKLWAQRFGRQPTAVGWNIAHANHTAQNRARWDSGDWPSTTTVQLRFGSWNDAIKAAGFVPLRVGGSQAGMEECREVRERYEAGESTLELAAVYGVSDVAIGNRVRKAGGRLRSQAEASRSREAKRRR